MAACQSVIVRPVAVALTIFVTLFASSSNCVFASEGFNPQVDMLPLTVQNAWQSTFMLLISRPPYTEIGTAFLIKKIIKGNSTDLYFLTNNHVIERFCPSKGTCSKAQLIESPDFEFEDGGTYLRSTSGIVWRDIEVAGVDSISDLALLHVSGTDEAQSQLKPLRISKSCDLNVGDPLYSIGFASTYLRIYPDRLRIANQSSVLKRWSGGLFIAARKINQNGNISTREWVATTVDFLPGDSGSELLNKDGMVIGVQTEGASTPQNKFRYTGDERANHLDLHSLAVKCSDLSTFIVSTLGNQ